MQPYTKQGALLSECGLYRYWLYREWGKGKVVSWVGLNPSTADAKEDDNTIRKVVGFSERFGFKACYMLNLFAYRSTNPALLDDHLDIAVGPQNDWHLSVRAIETDLVIAAWGGFSQYQARIDEVLKNIVNAGKTVYCLGTTKDGQPRHPLYLKNTTPLQYYRLIL